MLSGYDEIVEDEIVDAWVDDEGKYRVLKPTDDDYANKRSRYVRVKKSELI
jgi:hypothetical protein